MPWSEKQVQTFRALEHRMKPKSLAKLKQLGKEKLGEMADEGPAPIKPRLRVKPRLRAADSM